VRLVVIGSSPAWPNARSAHSGYVVESDGRRLLLDCGPGVLGRLREREAWPTVEAIAITHFHLDHWGDLVPWVWGSFYRRGQGDERPELWVYRGGRAFLEELGARLGFPDMFERTFDVAEYDAETPFRAAGLEVLPVRLPHYRLETYGFRVTNGTTTLAYTGDTGPSERIAAFTSAPPPLVEPPSMTRSRFAASLSEGMSIARSSRSTGVRKAGGPSSRASTVTAIASLSVDAAGNLARAFHAAPAPVARFST